MLNMNRKTASEDMRSQHLQNASADQSHARDMMYIRSQTFQNSNLQSNWREKRSPTLLDQNLVGLRKDQIVNNFMPSFGTKTSAFLQTPLGRGPDAVENLTPKFLNIELNENVKSQENQISQDGRNKEAQQSPQRSINEPWRSNLLRKEENKAYALKQKLHFGVQLSEDELEFIRFPKSIEGMLGSKRALYETLNELDSKTLKVQMSELEAEDMALQHLKNEMIQFYPDCRIIPYGVRLLGMAHPGSAMYMFFDSGKQYFKAPHENKNKQKEVRERVYHKMKTCGHCSDTKDWDKQELVTFMHIDTGLNCVISFVNGFKERSTLLLRMFMKIDKRLRLLTLLVSDLIYQYHNISRMFTSYVLNIMIIMYLQKLEQPVLPTLQKLRESFNYEKVVIGSFNCGFPEDFKLPPSQNHLSVEELLKGFCNFYKNFNFNENIISIMGPNLKKSYFLPPYNTPVPQEEQICSYINDLKTSRNTATLNIDCPLVVQEPFELSSNSAEKVNGTVLTVFKVMCQDVTDILSRWC